ncbi:hypothetical protein KDU71_07425 [Carboxylicivirga sediminis]|uniref:Uncharacterized protein n=1 Tax=Carboxylicivirga sediminis TaxID=2006564 RepID=A0A941F260_9BACT|nr:hypothetical protein [Carboxylicivirga sediminis]MBR8535386.1 hypothetical protein [Carboxylicivirga sediminis]
MYCQQNSTNSVVVDNDSIEISILKKDIEKLKLDLYVHEFTLESNRDYIDSINGTTGHLIDSFGIIIGFGTLLLTILGVAGYRTVRRLAYEFVTKSVIKRVENRITELDDKVGRYDGTIEILEELVYTEGDRYGTMPHDLSKPSEDCSVENSNNDLVSEEQSKLDAEKEKLEKEQSKLEAEKEKLKAEKKKLSQEKRRVTLDKKKLEAEKLKLSEEQKDSKK